MLLKGKEKQCVTSSYFMAKMLKHKWKSLWMSYNKCHIHIYMCMYVCVHTWCTHMHVWLWWLWLSACTYFTGFIFHFCLNHTWTSAGHIEISITKKNSLFTLCGYDTECQMHLPFCAGAAGLPQFRSLYKESHMWYVSCKCSPTRTTISHKNPI